MYSNKESWIETLTELLNEYENRDDDQQIEWRIGEWDKGEKGKVRGIVNEVYMWWVSELVVCSDYYWFIKWLVDNDKIDIKKLIIKGEMRSWWDFENKKWDEEVWEEIWNKYFSELTLMLLSIQDNPIEFLCSILK